MTGPLLLKLGGELLETAADRARIARLCAAISSDRPLVVVHGGGRAIDVELGRRGITSKKVDGLRITDEATLDAVVAVLAGSSNTMLVASLVAEGVQAVGLTGVDAGFGRAVRAEAHRTSAGDVVDLGLVGDPADADGSLVELLMVQGYVPVIASLGLEEGGAEILNVNADVMACRLASAIGASELVIAGATAGVVDASGHTMPVLDADAVDTIVADGTATAGMIAKLTACRQALVEGVPTVRIVDGRAFDAASGIVATPGTTLVTATSAALTGAR
jgi:acetylglutamate kinase